jgi:hypothetical protein
MPKAWFAGRMLILSSRVFSNPCDRSARAPPARRPFRATFAHFLRQKRGRRYARLCAPQHEPRQRRNCGSAPRDGFQARAFIPTENRIALIEELAACGFLRIEIGSFVDPKAVPQQADTPAVLERRQLPMGTR